MNFQDLFNKIKAIDEGVMSAPAPALAVASGDEVLTGECGGDMPGDIMRPPTPKQSDSVTMNVSINGSGAGGIRDLMNVIKDIQNGPEHDDVMGGAPEIDLAFGEEQADGGFTSATTSPEQHVGGVEMVTPMGNDIHSKGGEAEKVNGGGNPMGLDETLVAKLSARYAAIKEGATQTKWKELYGRYLQDRVDFESKFGKKIPFDNTPAGKAYNSLLTKAQADERAANQATTNGGMEEGMWDTIKQGAQSAVQGAQNLKQQAGQAVQQAGQAVANTTLGDIGNAAMKYNTAALAKRGINAAAQGITDVNKAAYGAVGDAAKAVGQKVAGAVAPIGQKIAAAVTPARPMAPVKPSTGFDAAPGGFDAAVAPEAEFGDLPPQAQFGDLPPKVAPAAPAKPQLTKPGSSAAVNAAFGESSEMTAIRRLAGL